MSPIVRLLVTLANATTPLTSREVADAIGIDYRRNFNKREAKYAKKLEGFITRGRLDAADASKVIHWSLADEWKGRPVSEVIDAFQGARA